MYDVNDMGSWVSDIWELFVLSAKFFCEPKTILKEKDIFRNISNTQKKWLLIQYMWFGAWDSAFLVSSWYCSHCWLCRSWSMQVFSKSGSQVIRISITWDLVEMQIVMTPTY